MLTLGYASGPENKVAARKMAELANLMGRLALIEIGVRAFESYDDLTQTMFRGEVDLAWLPPISFLALVSKDAVAPLAAVRRVPYQSAIIVAEDSPLTKPGTLVGQRAAWVDLHSASGYVIPRLKLARFGIDPRTAFSHERFWGSHEAVVAAVANGTADFGATWSQSNGSGPWSRTAHRVRTLATFGSIPPDVIAARSDLAKPTRKSIVNALKTIQDERQSRWLVSHVMGTEAFYRPNLELYGPLQDAVGEAFSQGLLGDEPTMETPVSTVPSARGPMRTIPDAVDSGDIMSVSDSETWELDEIEIDVTFD